MPMLVRCLQRAVGPEVPDALLLERFVAQRDEAAFELLVWRHQRDVLAVCLRVLGDVHDAEDAFQATFLTLARKAGSIVRRPSLGPWLRRVAYRVALRASLRSARRASEEERASAVKVALASTSSITAAAQNDMHEVLHEEMDRLAEKYRVPLALCYLEGQTNEQAARRLGCPAGTIATRLARGRKLLRSRMARRGIGLAGGLVPVALADSIRAAAPELVHNTVCAALAWTGGGAPSNLISPRVVGLTEEALRSMSMMKMKLATACVVALGILALGTGVVAALTPADEPPKSAQQPEANRPAKPGKPAEKLKEAKGEKGDHGHKITEKVTKSFKTGTSPRVVLDTFNGAVTIRAESKDGVAVELTKEARGDSDEAAKEAMKAIDISLTQEGNEVHVTAKRRDEDKDKSLQVGVSAELTVPAGAVLEVRTLNGGMKLSGGSGKVTLATSNGAIDVRDATGPVHLNTSNGSIRVIGGAGATELKTSNGAIEIQRERGVVAANTSNGSITFKGSLADGNQTFKTTNGSIALTLPGDAQFRVEAGTSLGVVASDFNPAESRRRPATHLKATVGQDPKTAIEAHTSNGSISLRKAAK
jgi:RNA polymerase sigma factor (sigma-70 family)